MPYRQVIRAGKDGTKIASHSRQHARRIATAATDRYRDRLAPEREFLDLYEYQIYLGEELVEIRGELIAIDNKHAAALQRLHELRQERDRWMEGLRDDLLLLKKTSEGYWGPGASRKLFREDPRLPQEPMAMHQMAERAFDTLVDPGFDLEPVQSGVAVSPRALARSFEPKMLGLGENLRQIQEAESEAKRTQSRKDEALEKSQGFNGKVIRFYESLFDLAGEPRLAGRLRNSSHVRPEPADGSNDDPGDGSAPPPASTVRPFAAPETVAAAGDGTATDGGEEEPTP